MEIDFGLKERVIVVTGAGSGLGRVVAKCLADVGAYVIITELPDKEENALEVVSQIQSSGGKSDFYLLDVRDTAGIRDLMQEVEQRVGRIDVLVNNAGVNIRGSAMEVNELQWDTIVDVNLKGTFFMSQAAAKIMSKHNCGKIINISSILAVMGERDRSPYSASKGGVVSMTRALAVEWASFNITVNSISPTYIPTEINAEAFTRSDFRDYIVSHTPLRSIGTPMDIVGPVIFLCGSGSDFITGQNIVVDGGWTLI